MHGADWSIVRESMEGERDVMGFGTNRDLTLGEALEEFRLMGERPMNKDTFFTSLVAEMSEAG